MGMTVQEMYEEHSVPSLINAVIGFTRAQHTHTKTQWETARYTAYHCVNIMIAKKQDKLKSPVELGAFPWEPEYKKQQNKAEQRKASPAEYEAFVKARMKK